jgi:hypothetical protein
VAKHHYCPGDEMDKLFANCDQDVNYDGFQDAVTLAYINNGSCSYSISRADGIVPSGFPLAGSMPYVTSSNGNYVGPLTATQTANLQVGILYLITITITATGYSDTRILRRVAYNREED